MRIGAQLYTVRTFTQTPEDFRVTMKKISEIGYQVVQLSAIGKDVKPDIAKEICDEYGLKIAATHSDVDRILHDTKALIEEHITMGCHYIGLGSMPEKYRNLDWIGQFAKDFKEPVKQMKDAGMLFLYHNHDFEFEKVGGKYFMDYMLEDLGPDELGILLDTYWVQTAGGDVCQWITKLKDRIPCIHLKDRGIANRQSVMAPVMEGNMNFPAILKTLEATCCEYALVEQDTCLESPFTCLQKSFNNLSKLGYQ